MSIRFKVILPYLLLTLLVAVTGVYVVTNLVTNTLSERLTNQLLEAGRVVSDDMARKEIEHIEAARFIAYTRGVALTLSEDDNKALRELVLPAAAGQSVENLLVFDKKGNAKLHSIKRSDGGFAEFNSEPSTALKNIVLDILAQNDPEALPQRIIEKDTVDGKYYYYTAVPAPSGSEVAGVVLVGTPLNEIVSELKSTSLANIILYNENGEAIATTFRAEDADDLLFVSTLNISEDIYQKASVAENVVDGENLEIDGRDYRLARGSLRVSDTDLGVFAVALPLQFVIETGSISRNNYVAIFTVAMLVVIAIGYIISRMIIIPLSSLVNTSQAITAGDLTKRSGIQSRDEIGTLAYSFDEMTERLQKHTAELQRTNKMLEQMDQTKASFIQISAHELRTPLTLVKGYAQMLKEKASADPQLDALSQGILDGYERMASVVGNMLDVSKIDSQTMEITPGAIQMGLLIMQLQKEFKPALEERDITIATENLSSLPLLNADPTLIKKAFYHILINAIKYTPNGGDIIVRGQEVLNGSTTNQLEIIVEDTGIGIATEHQELIFEKFYQTGEVLLHSSGKTNFKGGGPGLGLSIAQGIIEAHKGKIWVESPGYNEVSCPGSKFYIHLPLENNKRE